ncbi:hypothetical protein BCR34DRAFT_565343 [Clohesyomyces aquaticus]|uniref:Uncharacterized protein n=1 Tax=Clohesyomyces aquaticus TaxID=1231657 RepID=A0A1Y1ZML5_9PLEO|nr:hypothetical protein BCR34DRAFT_565343 [Clohesyomyces aquaticus]
MHIKKYISHFFYTITHRKLFNAPTSHIIMATEAIVVQRLSSTTAIYEPPLDAAASTNEVPHDRPHLWVDGRQGPKPEQIHFEIQYSLSCCSHYTSLQRSQRYSWLQGTTFVQRTLATSICSSKGTSSKRPCRRKKVLIYAFSNGGSMNLAAVSKAYRHLTVAALPARLVVFDSLPGDDNLMNEFSR